MPSLRPRVLVVDRDRELLTAIGDLAVAEGFEVSSTADAVTALAQLRHRPAHVVLIDARGGIDALRLLRATREMNPSCRVALMSGDASSDSAMGAVASGAA